MIAQTEQRTQPGAAVEALYASYHAPLLAYLAGLVGDRAVAEDLCQDTFLKAWRAWDAGTPIANAGAWLYRIASNTAYDHLRRRRRIRFTPLRDGLPPPTGAHSMESRLNEQEPVQRALSRLPAQYRVLLVLRDGTGHSTEEVADVLGCSPNAVRLRLFRARVRFRQAYLAAAEGAACRGE